MNITKANKAKITYMLSQAVFWCTYGISWSYTASFLSSKGYSSFIIGLVTGIGAVISVILQPVIADVTRRFNVLCTKRNIIILKTLSLAASAFIMLNPPGAYTTAVLFTVLTAIDASVPSMLSTLAMDYINGGNQLNFGLARGCGSISYATFTLILGYVVQYLGADILMAMYIILGIINIITVVSFPSGNSEEHFADNNKDKNKKQISDNNIGNNEKQISADNQDKHKNQISVNNPESNKDRNILRKYPFLIFFLTACVLLYIAHNIFNVFLLNIVQRAGGDNTNLGIALAISAFVELPAMAAIVKIAKKISIEKVILISSISFTLKAAACVFAVSIPAVYAVSAMQMIAFALFTPGSVYFINKYMQPHDSAIGQALIGSCTLGLGGTLGNIIGGLVIDIAGLTPTLIFAAILSACGTVVMFIAMKIIKTCNRH